MPAAYYRAPKPFSYYDTDGGSGHCDELLDSALNWLDKRGFDFSTLTVDANKNIKGLSFHFVGNFGANGLWGHTSSHGSTFDGVITASSQISELGTTEMHLGGFAMNRDTFFSGGPMHTISMVQTEVRMAAVNLILWPVEIPIIQELLAVTPCLQIHSSGT